MLFSSEKPTGTDYTTTTALLIPGLVFIPAVLIISRPLSYVSLSAAIMCGAICTALARINWIRSSQLSISSIAYRGTDAK